MTNPENDAKIALINQAIDNLRNPENETTFMSNPVNDAKIAYQKGLLEQANTDVISAQKMVSFAKKVVEAYLTADNDRDFEEAIKIWKHHKRQLADFQGMLRYRHEELKELRDSLSDETEK